MEQTSLARSEISKIVFLGGNGFHPAFPVHRPIWILDLNSAWLEMDQLPRQQTRLHRLSLRSLPFISLHVSTACFQFFS